MCGYEETSLPVAKLSCVPRTTVDAGAENKTKTAEDCGCFSEVVPPRLWWNQALTPSIFSFMETGSASDFPSDIKRMMQTAQVGTGQNLVEARRYL